MPLVTQTVRLCSRLLPRRWAESVHGDGLEAVFLFLELCLNGYFVQLLEVDKKIPLFGYKSPFNCGSNDITCCLELSTSYAIEPISRMIKFNVKTCQFKPVVDSE
jgi:hypothetical protein